MKILFNFFLFVGIFASCEQLAVEQEKTQQQQITRDDLEQQFVAIEAFIEEGSCDNAEGCNFIAYGSKACGGPQGYLIFPSNVDKEELSAMVDRYNKAEAAYNEQQGMMSDCSIPPEPKELGCESGDCVRIE